MLSYLKIIAEGIAKIIPAFLFIAVALPVVLILASSIFAFLYLALASYCPSWLISAAIFSVTIPIIRWIVGIMP